MMHGAKLAFRNRITTLSRMISGYDDIPFFDEDPQLAGKPAAPAKPVAQASRRHNTGSDAECSETRRQ